MSTLAQDDGLVEPRDFSPRPDVSRVNFKRAEWFAFRMFEAVTFVRIGEIQRMHAILNRRPELYIVAMDLFKGLCKQRGVVRGAERWRDLSA